MFQSSGFVDVAVALVGGIDVDEAVVAEERRRRGCRRDWEGRRGV